MLKLSSIFGIVSVFTLAIIGGVFIRNKIISDNLYAKALAEAEINWKKKVKNLEEEITAEKINLQKNKNDENNLNRKIKKSEEDVEKLETEIKKYLDEIEKLKNSIDYLKIKNVDKILRKHGYLKNNIQKNRSQISDLYSIISQFKDEHKGINEEKLLLKVKNLETINLKREKIIQDQKPSLLIYAGYRIKIHEQLKNKNLKKDEKIKDKDYLQKIQDDNKKFLENLKKLISELTKSLNSKEKILLNLKTQNPKIIGILNNS